jgi:hypothetical protein
VFTGPGRAGFVVMVCAVGLALAPAAALAATKPTAGTGAAAAVAQQTATLRGSSNPGGVATSVFFQYGPTAAYGAATAPIDVGAGTAARAVAAPIVGLAPFTTYHFRLVARNALGQATGADHTFKTKRQPLGLALAATPNPLPFGGATTLQGTLSGTGNASRGVVLQANPFPYTQGFRNVANPQLTNAQGGFAFAILSVPLNTLYRVAMPDQAGLVSPIVSVGVAVKVSTRLTIRRSGRSASVRFSGSVTPARDGAQLAIQKRRDGRWITIGGTITHHASVTHSRYEKTVRVRRGGTYRVFVRIADGNFVSGVGRSREVRVRR